MTVAAASVARFVEQLTRLMGGEFVAKGRLGLAVSGGPDSLALAILAAAAMPGRVRAATVDHGLNPDGARWAEQAASACAALDIPHSTLTVRWDDMPPTSNRQARARDARYALLSAWLSDQQLSALATAHHLDDQAETLLMRLDRGAGVGGLSGIRTKRPMSENDDGAVLIRPLLSFRRCELEQLVAQVGLAAVDDPANRDPAHDRARIRQFLAESPTFPDRERVAASAAYLGEADDALDWSADALLFERAETDHAGWRIAVADVPRELQRRAALALIARLDPAEAQRVRGDVLARALERVRQGEPATVGAFLIRPLGDCWTFALAPPRRN